MKACMLSADSAVSVVRRLSPHIITQRWRQYVLTAAEPSLDQCFTPKARNVCRRLQLQALCEDTSKI